MNSNKDNSNITQAYFSKKEFPNITADDIETVFKQLLKVERNKNNGNRS